MREISSSDGNYSNPSFFKSAKPLAKKYKSFNEDYKELIKEFTANPKMGIDLEEGYRKVRMAVSSKGKGKSGGSRVITLDIIERQVLIEIHSEYSL